MKKIPSIHQPIQKPDGSMEYVWYLFLQWVSENAGVADLSDYFTKEETQALLDAKANVDDLADVAFSGNYNDLTNKPTIPTVNNATLTIQKNGATVKTFTANASTDVTANITVPTKISDLTNDSNFANTDLSNLTDTGKNIANWSSNVTNCLTEIPQDIKLELASGVLTLKSGSKVYVPNGSGVFDIYTETNDRTISLGDNGEQFICVNANTGGLQARLVQNSVSGAGVTTTAGFAYNTTTNQIRFYNASGVDQGFNNSFPIAIVTVSGGTITRINQTFNGLGYIGSTLFVLPGVKGLVPNGRKTNGTLNNTEFTISAVRTVAVPSGYTGTLQIRLRGNYFGVSQFAYDEETNYNFMGAQITPDNTRGDANVGEVYVESGVIKGLAPKYAFHAVDYSEFKITDNNNPKLNQTRPFVAIQTMKDTEHAMGTYNSDVWHSTYLTFQDANGTRVARVQGKFVTGTNIFELGFYAGDVCIRVRSNGYILAPANSGNNTVLTTSAHSNQANGYYKLGNGLIIQWGVNDRSSSNTVNLPTAFSSGDSYHVAFGGRGAHRYAWTTGKTSTSFTFDNADDSSVNNSGTMSWIAIGY